MITRPNLAAFAIALAGTIVSGLWLVQYFLGREPSWGLGAALFVFLMLGTAAVRMNREYNFWETDQTLDDRRAEAELIRYLQTTGDERQPAAGEMTTLTINGRVVPRYKPANDHEAAWLDALEKFILHAWAAQSLSGPALIGRAVKGSDDWFAITEVLMAAGVVVKRNGVGTILVQPWTYRRLVAAIQTGELPLTLPAAKPPPTLPLQRAPSPAEVLKAKGQEGLESAAKA
jgi:hypothetical protein